MKYGIYVLNLLVMFYRFEVDAKMDAISPKSFPQKILKKVPPIKRVLEKRKLAKSAPAAIMQDLARLQEESVYFTLLQLCNNMSLETSAKKSKMAQNIAAKLEAEPERFLVFQRISPEILLGVKHVCERYWKQNARLLILLSAFLEFNAYELAHSIKDSQIAQFTKENPNTIWEMYYIPARMWSLDLSIDDMIEFIRTQAKEILSLISQKNRKFESALKVLADFQNVATKDYIAQSKERIETSKNLSDKQLEEFVGRSAREILSDLYMDANAIEGGMQAFLSAKQFLSGAVRPLIQLEQNGLFEKHISQVKETYKNRGKSLEGNKG